MDSEVTYSCDEFNNTEQKNSLKENEISEVMEPESLVELTQRVNSNENVYLNTTKRPREEEETQEEEWEDWSVVKRKEKKLKEDENLLQIYIYCKEKLPKQFAMGKLFKENGIIDVLKLKYISPYKARVDMANEDSANKLQSGEGLISRGWKMQKAFEKHESHGVIRNIDLEISDEDIFKSISCPSAAQLVAVKRLKRRNVYEEWWSNSESVRLSFKGSFLPAYVLVENLRIKVEPYVFPVSQCSRCWRFGHIVKFCPSSKIVCPKCTQNHANCDTKSFTCINCKGHHMALDRSCPAYIKEKSIRQLMADFNCTYKKALVVYVPPKSPAPQREGIKFTQEHIDSDTCYNEFEDTILHEKESPSLDKTTYAKIVKTSQKKNIKKKSIANTSTTIPIPDGSVKSEDDENSTTPDKPTVGTTKIRNVHFSELLSRLKEIILVKNFSLSEKIHGSIKCIIEWLILVLVDNISDWPILANILDFFNG
ncbi:unnamed protein product [Euphydryas editha]|uniref:Reverse transcriptase n=1 Tax=Euphydryas editha TaxID=104508 RepID=A0AAU9TMJ4_EUPED|nr:unnamed protein product [Euphydryas editha]